MLDAAVYHIPSRKLLFRAPGLSRIKGSATPVNLSEQLRADSLAGFKEASVDLVANLKVQLEEFKTKVKESPGGIQNRASTGIPRWRKYQPDFAGACGSHGRRVVLDRPQTEQIGRRIFLALFLVAGGSAIVFALPAWSSLLVYERRAILSGELWRILTGHLVHFSLSHLLYNLLGLLLAAWIIWRRGYRHFGTLCITSACTISCTILLFQPDLAVYGGLSGIVNAAILYAACMGLKEEQRWRRFSMVIIALCAVENSFSELFTGQPTLASTGAIFFVPVPLAHLAEEQPVVFALVSMRQACGWASGT